MAADGAFLESPTGGHIRSARVDEDAELAPRATLVVDAPLAAEARSVTLGIALRNR